jgi:hypothetical protein
MSDEELRLARSRAGHHEEAVLYVRNDIVGLPYMSVVVFEEQLWLSVGEQAGERTRIALIRYR